MNSFDQLISLRDDSRVGQTLQFKILRDGNVRTLPVKLRKKI
ncbi:MAG: hypothetical protein IPI18_18050 [Saprospiraceae bacterium]|nr:hypothetical protein [Saprospiraceae bacterium]